MQEQYDVDAWYAAVNWMLTGESYADTYKDGLFGGRMKPKNDFTGTGSGWGAWEIGARLSKFDGSDFANAQTDSVATITTPAVVAEYNESKSYTFGLKFIPNPNARYMISYVKTNMDCVAGVVCTADEEKAINLRAQFDF